MLSWISRRFVWPLFLIAVFVAPGLGPSSLVRAQAVVPEVAAQTGGSATASAAGTPRQQAWLKASIDQRARLAEQLGDEGARAFANAKGWKPIFDGTRRAFAVGPDQAYQGAGGVVHVLEAKGGNSRLGNGYGHAQGTPEWAVESAKRVLRAAKVTPAERTAAEAILRAADKGRLEVHVIRTSHVLGEPRAAVLEQSLRSAKPVARIARAALKDLTKTSVQASDDVARAVTGGAEAVASGSTTLKTIGKAAVGIGVAVDGVLRVGDGIETERQFADGAISQEQREVAHAKNVAGMAGGWGGAVAGAKLGAAAGGTAGSMIAPGPGTAIGAAVGGTAGGVAGYIGGEAVAEATAEWVADEVHASGTTISEAAGNAWNWTAGHCRSGWQAVFGE